MQTDTSSTTGQAVAFEESEQVGIQTKVNGVSHEVSVHPDQSALSLLREQLGLTGTKQGCGHGACGACAIQLDGETVASCLLPATSLEGKSVKTVEGLAAEDELHPVQRAFLANDALQCGFCTPGFVVEATAFFESWRHTHGKETPSREQVTEALAGHLCRCGAYQGIVQAVQEACQGLFDDITPTAPRVDAPAKVTGKAEYTVDVKLPGQLEGAVLRSPRGHAQIKKLDWSAAAKLPGVEAVVDMTTKARRLRYAGQEIVAIAAVNKETAEAALAHVVLELEPLPVISDMDAARAPGSPLIYPNKQAQKEAPNAAEGAPLPMSWDGNTRGPFKMFSRRARRARKAIEQAKANDYTLVEGKWQAQVQSHTALEPHACVAHWESPSSLRVYLSTQAVNNVADDIAKKWKLRREDVHLQTQYVGGGFGAKAKLDTEAVAAIELAKATKRPVRVVLSRREEILVGGVRPAHELNMTIATDAQGNMAGLSLKAFGDAGCAVGNACGIFVRILYPKSNLDIQDYDVLTNGPPGKAFRGPGGPPAFFALEQAVDEAARRQGVDPISLRRRWDGSAIRHQLYDWAEALPIWRERRHRSADKGRYRRGVGMATGAWFHFANAGSKVRLETGPQGLVVSTASQDMGNGTRTILAEGVAKVFGVPASQIDARLGKSEYVPGPTSGGSQTTTSVFPAATEAATQLKDYLLRFAISHFSLKGVQMVDGGLRHEGGMLPWEEIWKTAPPQVFESKRPLDQAPYFLPFAVSGMRIGKRLGSAVQVTHVEVDTKLGKTKLLGGWSGIAVGTIVSPMLARSQALGGMIQGYSYALYEDRRLDPNDGYLLTGGLEDYRIAGIGDIPPLEVYFLDQPFEGVKGGGIGLGELVTLAPAASVANAITNATGWRPMQMPIRPDRVLEGLSS